MTSGVAAAAHRDDAGALREAVRRQDGRDLQFVAQPLDQLQRDHGGAGDHQAQRREIVPFTVGVVEDLLVEGGRTGEDGDPFGGDVGERGRHAEDRLGDHRRPAQQAGDDAGLVAEGVEERVDDEIAVALLETGQFAPDVVRAQGLRVGDHRAFGVAGGAGGEDDVRRGVGAQRVGTGAHRRAGHRLPGGEEVPPGHEVGGGVVGEHHHLVQVRQSRQRAGPLALLGGAAQRGDVGGAEEGAGDEEQLGAGTAQDIGGLDALEAGVDRDEGGAGRHRAEGGDDPLDGVGRPDRDAVAGRDAGGDTGRGGPLHPLPQLGVRQSGAAVGHGLAGSVALGRRAHQPRKGAVLQVRPRFQVTAHRTTSRERADYPSD